PVDLRVRGRPLAGMGRPRRRRGDCRVRPEPLGSNGLGDLVEGQAGRLGLSSGRSMSIAAATVARPALARKVAELPSRSHSMPAPRLARGVAMPVTNQKAP